jgi:hypothetical protein
VPGITPRDSAVESMSVTKGITDSEEKLATLLTSADP